jgi:RluA family pseudouridine synthase
MAKPKPFTIIYKDDCIIAVNKASGIAVMGERWDEGAPRLDLLIKQELEKEKDPPLFTVHRIDKDTSGLVIFARDRETHKALSAAFEDRRVEKTYTAVIHGRPFWPGGKTSCDLPLVPDGNKKHLTVIDKYQGKPSQTEFTLILSAGNYSVVEARPTTGRTHQIRVHLSALGHPIVCDPLYGKHVRSGTKEGVFLSSFKQDWRGDALEERPLLDRLGLHALRLVLDWPGHKFSCGGPSGADASGSFVLEAPLPRDMAALVKQMEKSGNP